jgi:quercetin 2,3-dioxygenase
MKCILHKAADRIINDLGWLRIHASFREEADHNDKRRFGKLVILDDATMIPGGRGFKLHPHENMEIISWILSGTDEHNDSENGITLLRDGDVQLMSAGTGIEHAENNYSATVGIHMFQIWIEPAKLDVKPLYQIKSLRSDLKSDELYTFISPTGDEDSLTINQNAYLSLLKLSGDKSTEYKPKAPANGIYIFIVLGSVSVNDIHLTHRDALGVYPGNPVVLTASQQIVESFWSDFSPKKIDS